MIAPKSNTIARGVALGLRYFALLGLLNQPSAPFNRRSGKARLATTRTFEFSIR